MTLRKERILLSIYIMEKAAYPFILKKIGKTQM
jgi:hypothetical protein